MRVLITGGAGRLGLTICKAFLGDGYKVALLDLDSPRNRTRVKELGNRVIVHWGDVTDPESVSQAINDADMVVHMAAILPPVAYQKPLLAEKVNVEGTRTVVAAVKEKGIPLIYTSSVAAFGPTPGATEPISPVKQPPKPKGAYGETKVKAENVIRQAGVDYAILRLTATMYLSFYLSDLKRMFSVPLNNRVEFCHPDDTARAIINAVRDFPAVRGKTLVISGGSKQRMLYKDMVSAILAVMGLPLPPDNKFTREPYYLDWYDTNESQRLLRFQQKAFADYIKEYRDELSRRYTRLFIPFMRYFVSPLFGRIVVQLM